MQHTNVPPSDPSPEGDEAIADAILVLLATRAPSASICPSDVARAMATDEKEWRAKMPEIRRVAARLAAQGRVKVTRGKSTRLRTVNRSAFAAVGSPMPEPHSHRISSTPTAFEGYTATS